MASRALRRFDLDYARQTRPVRALGSILLVVGGLLLADTVRQVVLAQRSIESLERAIATETQSSPKAIPRAPARAVRVDELRVAEAVARRLTLPWEALFGPLESNQLKGIRLTAITPDAERRTVTLTGEAKDYLQVLNLVAALSHEETLSRVRLVRHEPRGEDPRFTVAFEVAARWGERP